MAANSEPAIPRQSTKPTSAGFTSNDGETQATNLRVCDTCIRKKVKCAFLGSQPEELHGWALVLPRKKTSNTAIPASVLTFFDILQDANPIFSRSRFLNNYRHSLCDSGLISTITTISARLTKSLSLQESVAVDDRIDLLLSSTAVQDNLFSDTPVLDQFRKSCILAVYEFHQFPGHQSWMRIGALTRMALRVGLDQLQNPRSLQPEWSAVSEEDLDEWRAIWWCIYRLDSYSNLSSGTPYLISEHLVTTAFILHDPQQSPPLQDNCGVLLDEQWLISWQEVLEICQNIACIAEQWDSSFCVKVDPAISFVVFTTLVFLDIHGKSITTPDGTLRVQIEHDKTVLRLMLEQFATIWTLPRLLKLSYVTFSESIPGSLTDRHIKRIILRFDAPLHSRWLQFLADPHKYLNDDQ
ncbi:hypothetical protein SNOG_15146 [Parastagonospora nodorum SN15]|uniref:Xylanolytic transcriptional activator regulatory domain-containing protein n=1 Tax=Phaeosphaeria nodorum (strain SN15 / ATCC MYA-4574 / FGSC 10173) TaxID=321614 RepID=Q0TZ10_PHANO|nr:hypothetical protein SNOG_15146 [Parastagonospora nodorum SN15]EAT77371.1 hypothetical protein SNOG_15146 [Parastagonospora nodorum SN15]